MEKKIRCTVVYSVPQENIKNMTEEQIIDYVLDNEKEFIDYWENWEIEGRAV